MLRFISSCLGNSEAWWLWRTTGEFQPWLVRL